MAAAVQKLKAANPEYEHRLFDDTECRTFIEENFPVQVLYAYDSLIPGAYKADLWRYCVLYLNGGVYLDIKFEPLKGFSFNSLIHNESFCFDAPSKPTTGVSIYNAFMIVRPGSITMKQCILNIYRNVVGNFYGSHCLEPTGPYMLGKYITKQECNTVNGYDKIMYNNSVIFQMYASYRNEQRVTSKHYSGYWDDKHIYHRIALPDILTVLSRPLPDISTNVIPNIVFQTWKTVDISGCMMDTIAYNRKAFPTYDFQLFSDKMAEEFIGTYFSQPVIDAYNALIPGAFKADLWRYCILYVYGGIYMDVKFKIMPTCNLDTMIQSEYFVKDRPGHFLNRNGVYNAFMIVKPRNKYMLEAIVRIIRNVRNKHYGHCALYPTGPGLLGEIIPINYDYKLRHDDTVGAEILIDSVFMGNVPILQSYTTYRTEQKKAVAKSYDQLWHERAIYA